ncbi:MAG: DUF1552 domain-containing protein [Kofleriaceae bacterium]
MPRISRRSLLRGGAAVAGGALVAPLVRQLRAAGPGAPSPRVVIVIEGNCFYTRAVLSASAQAAINAQASTPLTTQMICDTAYRHSAPLTVTANDLGTAASLDPLVAHGVDGKAAVVLGLSNKIAGGGHSSFQGGLACARGSDSRAPAVTIDAVLAARLGVGTPFDAIRVGEAGPGARLSYVTCAAGPGRPLAITTDPVDAYNRLFAAIVGGPADPRIQQQQRALEFAHADVTAALGTFGGSSAERAKLEAYLAAIESTQLRLTRLFGLAGAVSTPAGPTGTAGDPYASVDPFDRLGVQFDLVTAALLGGLTNVAVIASGPGGGLGLNYGSVLATIPGWAPNALGMDRHTLQHGIGQPIHQQAILAVTRKHVDLIGRMARTLDDTADPAGGTMLDHTIIVYVSDNGEQHHSEAREWPILLVGGRALGLATDGRTVVFPRVGQAGNRQLSNLWNTIGHATGDTSLDRFGQEGSGRIAEGPLAEIYSGA